jgi:hypothetical protein
MKRLIIGIITVVRVACVVALVGCGDTTGPTGPSATTSLSYVSDVGDFIGQGQSHSYAFADGQWNATFDTFAGAEHIEVNVDGLPGGQYWTLDFSAPPGQHLAVGAYEAATRWPFQDAQPGLSIIGNSRGCNTLTGRFVITALTLGPANSVDRFQATFVQHCEGGSPAFTGTISIAANPWR